jgi:DNA gyrase/topoisomerase IV subunit B
MPEWEKLTPYQQVRLRTEWIFGSRDAHTQNVLEYLHDSPTVVETTWVPAIFTCFREILDNALDEVITYDHGNRIDVCYESEVFSVKDNGRGIPIEWSDQHKNYAATVLLSEMMSGRNFIAERGETRGLNGIGAKGVNYCSEWFQVDVWRDKKQYMQRFTEGEELQIGEPTIWPTNSKKTGTTISFKLSNHVFPQRHLPTSFIAARLYEIALCYPKLHLTFNGTRIHGKLPLGVPPVVVDVPGFLSKFWLLPDTITEGDCVYSLVNGIPLFNGGSHVDAFRRHFYSGLLNGLEKETKRRKLTPNRADISDGLLIYNITEMTNPSFDSQSKTRLINEPLSPLIRQTLDVPDLYREIIRQHPGWIDAIYVRCAARTQSKDAKETIKQAKRNLQQKIEDLEDACGHDRSKCILFITEGKSASSGISSARDAQIHGAIPLTGKILNVFGESAKKVLDNEALSKLMSAIGLIPGKRANRHALRYGSVAMACDADEDGRNISCLLLNFFFKFWPELFQSDYFYVLETPLIIAVKGKQKRYWYNDDVSSFNTEKMTGWDITRAKGLAALTQEDWRIILSKPNLQPIKEDGALEDAFRLIFSQESGATDRRKSWIGM